MNIYTLGNGPALHSYALSLCKCDVSMVIVKSQHIKQMLSGIKYNSRIVVSGEV